VLLSPLDLTGLRLEKPGDVLSDQYIFSLTDKDGTRYYGICYRNFFRGISRRFDISRRSKHCICLISRFPYFAFFKTLLMDIFSSGLLEHSRGICKGFVYSLLTTLQNAFQSALENGGATSPTSIASSFFTVPIAQLLPFPLEHLSSLKVNPEFKYSIPKSGKNAFFRDVSLLPLFSILGTTKYFTLLSAILCEQRILFVSNDVNLLTTTILSTLSMIYPFRWHHVFITLLPPKLITYLQAPVPYIIGIKKSALAEVSRDAAHGVLLVDLDQGEVGPNGNVVLMDLIGDAGTALRQATESFDRLKVGFSSILGFGSNKPSSSSASGGGDENDPANQRDLMTTVVGELRSALSSRPGGNSLTSITTSLLRSLPVGSSKTVEEAKAQWSLETEKLLHDYLTMFYVYLFGDLDEFYNDVPSTSVIYNNKLTTNHLSSSSSSTHGSDRSDRSSSAASSKDLHFSSRDIRSKYDLKAFIYRKQQNGLSKLLHDFMLEFLHSQTFEQFCEERVTLRNSTATNNSTNRNSRSATASSTSSSSSASSSETPTDADDLYEVVCSELRYRSLPMNVTNIKHMVASKSTLHLGSDTSSSAFNSSGKVNSAGFHLWTLQYTSSSMAEISSSSSISPTHASAGSHSSASEASINGIELYDIYSGFFSKRTSYHISQNSIFERILTDCYSSDVIKKIFITISFRLESCKAGGYRGAAALSGMKALQLLYLLMLHGPNVTLPMGIELIPMLRSLLKLNQQQFRTSPSSSSSASAPAATVTSNISSASTSTAFDFSVGGNGINFTIRSAILVVLGVLADHRRLLIQRSIAILGLNGVFAVGADALTATHSGALPAGQRPALPPRAATLASLPPSSQQALQTAKSKQDLFIPGAASHIGKSFPSFTSLHQKFNETNASSINASVLKVTEPEKARLVEHEEEETNVLKGRNNRGRGGGSGGESAESLLEFIEEPLTSSTVSTSASLDNHSAHHPAAVSKAKSINLLDFSDTTSASQAPAPPSGGPAAADGRTSSPMRALPPLPAVSNPDRSRSVSPKEGTTSHGGNSKISSKSSSGASSPVVRGNNSPVRPPVESGNRFSGNNVNSKIPAPIQTSLKKGNKEVDLLGFGDAAEESPYRVKNLDTGEVMDIRDFEKIRQPVFFPSKPL
jgi:hypothetical protein